MKPTSSILRPLQRLASAGRVRALFRAMDSPKSSKERTRKAAESLISSIAKHDLTPEASRDAAEGLFRRWERLPETLRARLMRVSGNRWRAGLGRVATDDDPAVRRVVAGIAAKWPVVETIQTAGRLVLDPDEGVARAAEVSLLTVCEGAADLPAAVSDALDTTLSRLAQQFPEHRRKPILRAVLAVGRHAGPELRAWLAEGADAEIMPLRGMMKESGAISRTQAIRLLGVPALAATAADRLGLPASAAEHEASLAMASLLHARGRAGALGRLGDPLSTLPVQHDLERLNLDSRVGALRWAMACPVASNKRAVAVSQMLHDPEPVVRSGAVWRLGQLAEGSAAARESLQDVMFDADPLVALAAMRELHRNDPALVQEGVRNLVRSPVAELREAAQDMLSMSDPWALIEADNAAGWHQLRQRLATEPLRTIAAIRGRVAEGPAARRTLAVLAARRLGVTDEIENELLGAVAGDDERVASTSVLALGDLTSAASRAAVSSCLAHPDDRVRANAVEAIARRNPDEPVVRAWVENEVPRARANAVRARVVLAKDAKGAEALSKMLSDERRSHRLSGLWVAERAGMTGVSERVAEIARTEREPHVRERARRCARRLLAEMRWQENLPSAGRAEPTLTT